MEFAKERWNAYLTSVFKALHNMPELSWQEHRTTAYLAEQLRSWGYQTQTFGDCTGVVGNRGTGPITLALRADMDALCHSTAAGEEVRHTCGHDAHMAMVLTAAAALAELPPPENCQLKMIFQPAEEKGEGALKLIEKGVVEDVQFLFGVHLRPIQELPGGLAAPAIQNGAATVLQGEIQGLSAHGARPHLGINVIEVAAALVQALQSLHWNPLQPASVKMTQLRAGTEATNTIPDQATFALDIRAQTNQHMRELVEQVQKLASGVAQIYGATITLRQRAQTPAAEVSPIAQEILSRAIVQTLGAEHLAPPVLTPGAEDFHYYTQQRPGIQATMLGLGCHLQPGLHHPNMHFEESYLLAGAEILARAVWYAGQV